MQSLQALTGISGMLYLLATTVVAVRVLMLAKRNHGRPELMLGLALLLGGTFSASLEVVAGTALTVPSLAAGLVMLSAKIIGAAGIALYNAFIWKVFRPDSKAAVAAFWLLLTISAVSIGGFAAAGSFATGELDLGWFWVEVTGRYVGPLWMIYESFAYWSRMNKRAKLGLADPVVANRMLLWGVAATFGVVMLTTSITPRLAPTYDAVMNVNLLVLGLAGIASSICYWLAFLPPERYRRWIRESVQAAS